MAEQEVARLALIGKFLIKPRQMVRSVRNYKTGGSIEQSLWMN
jgi:hypothetical protein